MLQFFLFCTLAERAAVPIRSNLVPRISQRLCELTSDNDQRVGQAIFLVKLMLIAEMMNTN